MQQSAIEDIHVRGQRIIDVLFDALKDTMTFIKAELQKIPLHRAKNVEELEDRLKPYLRDDGRYVYSWLLGGENLDFLTLSWTHKNYIYTLVCGGNNLARKIKLNTYQTEPFFLPTYIDTEVKGNSLTKSMMLRYSNSLEFARSIALLTEIQPVVLTVSGYKQLAQLTVSKPRQNEFAIAVEFGRPAYHQHLDVLRLALSGVGRGQKEPPKKAVEEARVEGYRLFAEIELTLNELIRKQLQGLSSNWWTQRVPTDVQNESHKRRLRDEHAPWQPAGKEADADFMNFSDLEKIFLRRDNWDGAFKRQFSDETFLRQKLRELQLLRNQIMHPHRPFSQKDLERLKLDVDDLLNSIARA